MVGPGAGTRRVLGAALETEPVGAGQKGGAIALSAHDLDRRPLLACQIGPLTSARTCTASLRSPTRARSASRTQGTAGSQAWQPGSPTPRPSMAGEAGQAGGRAAISSANRRACTASRRGHAQLTFTSTMGFLPHAGHFGSSSHVSFAARKQRQATARSPASDFRDSPVSDGGRGTGADQPHLVLRAVAEVGTGTAGLLARVHELVL